MYAERLCSVFCSLTIQNFFAYGRSNERSGRDYICKKLIGLALVLNKYESELICDFAEYYHILDYRSIEPGLAGVLLQGLRPESRTKMKLTNQKITLEQTLLAIIADGIKGLIWMNSKKKNKKVPESILKLLIKGNKETTQFKGFESSVDFEKSWQKITGVGHGKKG